MTEVLKIEGDNINLRITIEEDIIYYGIDSLEPKILYL